MKHRSVPPKPHVDAMFEMSRMWEQRMAFLAVVSPAYNSHVCRSLSGALLFPSPLQPAGSTLEN